MQLTDSNGNIYGGGGLEITGIDGKPKVPVIPATLIVNSTPITGGAVGRVLFQGAGNVLQESSNLFWDDTNNRLGIGTASPDRPLHINSTGATGLRIDVTGGGSNAIFLGAVSSLIRWSNGAYFSNTGMYSQANDQQYITFDGTNTQVRLQIKASNGNIGIGTTTDAGFKLDVNGTARVKGAGIIGGTPFTSSRLEVGSALGVASQEISLALNKSNSNDRSWKFLLGKNADTQWGTYSLRIFNGGYTGDLVLGLGTGRLRIGAGFPDTADSSANFTDRLNILANGNVLINTTTDIASSKLTVESTTQGFLPPRMTNAQRLAIASPAVGLIVYCTDAVEGLYVNKSTGWTFVI